MNDKRYKYILYIIVAVIVATVGLQGYWNYKNHLLSKQQLIADVQTSLDKVVDDYYSQLAKTTTLGLTFDGNSGKDVLKKGGILDDITKSIDENNATFKGLDSLKLNTIDGVTVIKGLKADSLLKPSKKKEFTVWHNDTSSKPRLLAIKSDSLKKKDPFEFLTSKVVISINNDTLNVDKVDSLLQLNLRDKKIDLDYTLNYKKPKVRFPSIFNKEEKLENTTQDTIQNSQLLSVTSKSAFLPKGSTLNVYFKNANWAALKRGFSAVLISALLVFAVISCLFFCLKL